MKETVLIILDGYGISAPNKCNAVELANTATLKRLFAYPHAKLKASGRAVGLPSGFMGNSEVGHLNIGAGRIVNQDMTKIDLAIENNTFNKNPVLLEMISQVKAKNGRLHLMGLLSDGGVHSHINHIKALIDLASQMDCPSLVHVFTDGRDTAPNSALIYVQDLQNFMYAKNSKIASLCGRYYAMDRDNRWERVAIAYNMLTNGEALIVSEPLLALEEAYSRGENDEFFKPMLVAGKTNLENCVQDNDAVFFFNFRADRARELAHIFYSNELISKLPELQKSKSVKLSALASMTSYDEKIHIPIAFTKENLELTLGELISNLGQKQFRIAETEKYAHVTYFFNGGREEAFIGEERCLVDSPKDVKTYDEKPQMSAFEVCDKLIEAYKLHKYCLIVCNFANPDMLGHTGKLEATIQALETVDLCIAKIAQVVLNSGGRLAITADHGNAERMCDDKGKAHTAHTTNMTPFLILEGNFVNPSSISLAEQGKLADIAPTLLDLWNVPQPELMDGKSLVIDFSYKEEEKNENTNKSS